MKNDTLKQKRWPARLIIIIAIAMLVFPIIVFGLFWLQGLSLSYVDDLKYYQYKFSAITGEPFHLSKKAYIEKYELKEEISSDIFPKSSPDEGLFYYFFAESVKPNHDYDDRWEIYVNCRWNDKDYQSEKERLSSLTGFNRQTPLISYDLFSLPSYVFVYRSGVFKYAIYNDDDNSIFYIFLKEIGSLDNVVFDHSLAPQKRLQDSDLAKATRNGQYSY